MTRETPETPATPEAMAAIHAESMGAGQVWRAADIADLLAQPGVIAVTRADAFALIRVAAGEAEVLTLAVRPRARRRGIGAAVLADAMGAARQAGATEMFLEVAEDNGPARALYTRAGFVEVGRRPGYYPRRVGARVDALILRRCDLA